MVGLHERYGPATHNLAYEHLLAEEGLGDAAWAYLDRLHGGDGMLDSLVAHADDDLLRLFAVAADGHGEQLAELLTEPLQDADSMLLSDDSPANRLRIAVIVKLCRDLLPEPMVRVQRERLGLMYPKCKELQAMLDEVMGGHLRRT